jgi:16S rRNA (guanine527-N7)-methyltransferase
VVTPAPSAAEAARELYGSRAPALSKYVDILTTRGIERGLLGPKEAERVWDRHILNSAALSGFIGRGSTVIDVGSGAGLPGIPVALLRPDLRVTLLEPLLRRFTFLTETVAELALEQRVFVVRGRAEEHTVQYDVVMARAVAPLGRLITWCNPLRRAGGALLALKGESAPGEVHAAADVLRRLRVRAEVTQAGTTPGLAPAVIVRVTDA